MGEIMESIHIKKGEERKEVDGKLFRLLQRSEEMEAIADLEVGTKSDYLHKVGDEVHLLKEGDLLWHSSEVAHSAKNVGGEKDRDISSW